MEIRIGTRGSRLALIQTRMIDSVLKGFFSELKTEEVQIKTVGDKVLDRPLAEVGGKGVFVDSIESALSSGEIDLAVHSGKDIPSVISDEYSLYVITPRADVRDVLLLRPDRYEDYKNRKHMVVGTSSPRRKELLKRLLPDSEDKLLRGNVPTRVNKLRDGEYDGIILAAAGLDRLELDISDLVIERLDTDSFIPATSQGIIVCETLKDSKVSKLLEEIESKDKELVKLKKILILERRLSSYMNADCYDAAAVYARYVSEDKLEVRWFYGDSEINKEIISDAEVKEIIAGRDEIWKKRVKESVI